MIVSVKCSFWSVNKMYFGTEARLLKAEGSPEARVEVKGASSGMSGLWGTEAGGQENSVTGKGCVGIFQQGGLVWRRKNYLYLSFPPLLHYPPPLVLLVHSSYPAPCRSSKSGSAHRKLRGSSCSCCWGRVRQQTMGMGFVFMMPLKSWEQGSGVKLRVRQRLLDRKIFFQLFLTAACSVCGMALQDRVLIYCILFVPNQG